MSKDLKGPHASISTCMPISVNYWRLMLINVYKLPLILLCNITPDQLRIIGHGVVFTTNYRYSTPTILTVFCILGHKALVFDTYCPCLSRINTLTLNDTVERVSNYTGLDDCSVFTGLFYRENRGDIFPE